MTRPTVQRCDACGFDWTIDRLEVTAQIGGLPSRFRRALDESTARVRTRPAADVWSPIEYTAHVGDVVAFHDTRIRRIIAEDRPELTAPEGGLGQLVETGDHNVRSVADVLQMLEVATASVVALLNSLSPPDWLREGFGSSGVTRSVLDLARRIAHDGHHHHHDITG